MNTIYNVHDLTSGRDAFPKDFFASQVRSMDAFDVARAFKALAQSRISWSELKFTDKTALLNAVYFHLPDMHYQSISQVLWALSMLNIYWSALDNDFRQVVFEAVLKIAPTLNAHDIAENLFILSKVSPPVESRVVETLWAQECIIKAKNHVLKQDMMSALLCLMEFPEYFKNKAIALEIALIHQSLGAHRDAISILEEILTFFPNDPQLVITLSKSYREIGKSKKALQAFDTIVDDLGDSHLQKEAVSLLLSLKAFAKAAKLHQQLVMMSPAEPPFDNRYSLLVGKPSIKIDLENQYSPIHEAIQKLKHFPNKKKMYVVGGIVRACINNRPLKRGEDIDLFYIGKRDNSFSQAGFFNPRTQPNLYQLKHQSHPVDCWVIEKTIEDIHGFLLQNALTRGFTIDSFFMDEDGNIEDPTNQAFNDYESKILRTVKAADTVFSASPEFVLKAIRHIVQGMQPTLDVINGLNHWQPAWEAPDHHFKAILKKHLSKLDADPIEYVDQLIQFGLLGKIFPDLEYSNLDDALFGIQRRLVVPQLLIKQEIDRGVFAYHNEDYIAAIQHFTHTTVLEPKISDFYYALGRSYQLAKQYSKAVETYSRILDLEINAEYQSIIYNLRGIAYALHSVDCSELAIADFQHAIQLSAENQGYQENIDVIKQGKSTEFISKTIKRSCLHEQAYLNSTLTRQYYQKNLSVFSKGHSFQSGNVPNVPLLICGQQR